jgi:outer membrane lipoprotein-sorting protein
MEGFTSKQLQKPNLLRVDLQLGGKKIIQGFNGKLAWILNEFTDKPETAEILSDSEMKEMSEKADFDGPLVDYKKKVHSVELLGIETVDGEPCYHLRVTRKDGGKQDSYVSTGSYREVMIAVPGSSGTISSKYSDYRRVEGTSLPYRIRWYRNEDLQMEISVTEVRLNATIPSQLFDPPTARRLP